MASYAGSLKVFLSVQVPKYSLPWALVFSSREVPAGLGQETGGVFEGGGGGAETEVVIETTEVTVIGTHCEYHSLITLQAYPETQVVSPIYPIPPPRTVSNRNGTSNRKKAYIGHKLVSGQRPSGSPLQGAQGIQDE